MKRQRCLAVFLPISMALLLAVSPRAFGSPTPPTVSGSIATFTGDQSNGIWPESYWNCPPVYTFSVNDLTTDITAAGRAYGIELSREGADGTTGSGTWSIFSTSGGQGTPGNPGGETYPTVLSPQVSFDGGDHGITMSALFALGISTGSYGGDGGAGGSPIWHLLAAYGGNGGDGGLGLPVTVASGGDIQTSGWLSIDIAAESRGGNGGDGSSASAAGAAYGGHGGAGGNADEVAVTSDSHIQATGTAAVGVYASSAGGNGGAGGSAESIAYAKGGDGGPGGSGGPVAIHNHGSIVVTSTLPAESEWTGPVTAGVFGQSLGGAGGSGGYGGSAVGRGGGTLGSGPGGDVVVDNTGDIQTSGRDVHGIIAQSVGGFAGGGGASSGVVGWGASANSAGDGGSVAVANSGDIQTLGVASEGLLAQSVGGGGGSGSSAGGLVSLGGAGGSSGAGGLVTVENWGAITTAGNGSHSIFAESIGGGGGVMAGYGGASEGVFFTMGGSGAAGGNGGEVKVTNHGNLETSQFKSSGIFAQSVGGGGGAGGGAYDTGFSLAWAQGGSSTLGGDGKQVVVDSGVDSGDTSIVTAGAYSHGIHAQSLGGGGGSGGNVYTSVLGVEFTETVAVGGQAGDGGHGGIVNLTSGSRITTQGEQAHGLYAESVGGGGGDAGNATNLTKNFVIVGVAPITFGASLGGQGGNGGNGNTVTVNSTNDISTSGFRSYGIFAQSVGGGGGDGGYSVASVLAVNSSVTFNVSIGGAAQVAGGGGTVDVDSYGHIETGGDFAHGILAQSVGGGGGAGGDSSTLTTEIEVPISLESLLPAPGYTASMALGGASAGGGSGGLVDVYSKGDIITSGDFANGILAQSIGGGGGAGGDGTIALVGLTGNPLAGLFDFLSPTGTFSLGGSAYTGGEPDTVFVPNNGGVVKVHNDGAIVTEGDFANGILAQSVGGGVGVGGNSMKVSVDLSFNLWGEGLLPSLDRSLDAAVGGFGGEGGVGDTVTVDNDGGINTAGRFANGILAQSIGGGGGAGGDIMKVSIEVNSNPLDSGGSIGDHGHVSLGGFGGDGGNGGVVTVNNGGDIATGGNFANGILAQSIGGGGGANGSVTTYSLVLAGGEHSSKFLKGASAGTGDGGTVNVENSANIVTHGGFAHGILAQSIGGGGGFGGISENGGISTLDFSSEAKGVFAQNTSFGVGFAGSAGGDGSAGPVSVTHTGSITTLGNMSHGILAQSVAGHEGAAGPVTVTLVSSITAKGVDSDGIHAQSLGGIGNGNISVTTGGTVQGGSGAGAGVNLDGGANNTLTNAAGGSISALSG